MSIVRMVSLSLTLSLAAAAPAVSQNWEQTQPSSALRDPISLLRRAPGSAAPSSGGVKDLAQNAVAMGLAKAKVYKFASVDYPGTEYSVVQDKNATTVVGSTSLNMISGFQGFTFKGGNFQEFFLPNSFGSFPNAINTSGNIVGFFRSSDGYDYGFLDVGGVISNIEGLPYDINDGNEIVGSTGGSNGFATTDGGVTYTEITFPNANVTAATGVNTAGEIVGYWEDSVNQYHGFLLIGGQFTSFDFPLATNTYPQGVNDSGEIAGYFTDASSVTHGFILSGNAWAQVDVPGAQATYLTRIKNNGNITGYYIDQAGEYHGMTGH
jgi:hypothetical protein